MLINISTPDGIIDQTLDRYVDSFFDGHKEEVLKTLIFDPLKELAQTRLGIKLDAVRVLNGHGYSHFGNLWIAELNDRSRITTTFPVKDWISQYDGEYPLLAVIACNEQNLPFNSKKSYVISPKNITSLLEFGACVKSGNVNISYPSIKYPCRKPSFML